MSLRNLLLFLAFGAQFALFCVLLERLIFVPLQNATHWEPMGNPISLAAAGGIGQILLYLLAIGAIAGFVRRFWSDEARRLIEQYRHAPKGRIRTGFWTTAGWTLLVPPFGYVVFLITGGFTPSNEGLAKLNLLTALSVSLSLVTIVILALTEELLFRGFLLNYLRPPQSSNSRSLQAMPWGAIVASSMLFAFVHGFRDLAGWLEPAHLATFVGLTLLGVLLAITYLATGSLACNVGVHSALIWPEILRSRLHLVDLHQEVGWWMGWGGDIRSSPVVWCIFIALSIIIWQRRDKLCDRAAIEIGGESTLIP